MGKYGIVSLDFSYKEANKTIYKNNTIYEHRGYYTAFITNKFYRTLKDCKSGITRCINNGWELRPMKEVTEIINQAAQQINIL